MQGLHQLHQALSYRGHPRPRVERPASTKSSALTAESASASALITQNTQPTISWMTMESVSNIRWPFRRRLCTASSTIWMTLNIVLNGPSCVWALTMCSRSARRQSWSARPPDAYISEHEEQLPLISTACPFCGAADPGAFSESLIPHLLPLNPPVEVAAILAARTGHGERRGFPERRSELCLFLAVPVQGDLRESRRLEWKKARWTSVLAIKDVYPQTVSNI